MSITEELRTYIEGMWTVNATRPELRKIADRIDAEHESACGEAYGNGVQSVALPDMTAYVKLPVDADGVPIRVGDVVTEHEDGNTFRVDGFKIWGCGNEWWVYQENAVQAPAHNCTHHEPTVEDVLREFAEKVIDSQIPNVHPTYEEAIAEYAAKLRLAGDAE